MLENRKDARSREGGGAKNGKQTKTGAGQSAETGRQILKGEQGRGIKKGEQGMGGVQRKPTAERERERKRERERERERERDQTEAHGWKKDKRRTPQKKGWVGGFEPPPLLFGLASPASYQRRRSYFRDGPRVEFRALVRLPARLPNVLRGTHDGCGTCSGDTSAPSQEKIQPCLMPPLAYGRTIQWHITHNKHPRPLKNPSRKGISSAHRRLWTFKPPFYTPGLGCKDRCV